MEVKIKTKVIKPLWKTGWQFLKQLNIRTPYDPVIPLLGSYLNKLKILATQRLL